MQQNQNQGTPNQPINDASQRSQGSHHSNLSQQNGGSNDLVNLNQQQNQGQNLKQDDSQTNQQQKQNQGLDMSEGIDPLDPDNQDDPLLGLGPDDMAARGKDKSNDGSGDGQQGQSGKDDLNNDKSLNVSRSGNNSQPNPAIPKTINTGPSPDMSKKNDGPSQRRGSMTGRGRGAKGKRLREMSDDLPQGASLPLDAFQRERKRGADAMSGDTDEPASKASKTGDGDGEDSSLLPSMFKSDGDNTLAKLSENLHVTARSITRDCLPIIKTLIKDPFGWVFRDAVDPVVFGLPDYFEIVKNPMHLSLVQKKLENAVYTDMASFQRDVKLVFDNAILYNGDDSDVGQLAEKMMRMFDTEYKKVLEKHVRHGQGK
uniref:Bromo domain-containing protein n=1 Tax=Craspedostauros australis TaxID=1486917 RepID=A0A7R9WZA1_9STRA